MKVLCRIFLFWIAIGLSGCITVAGNQLASPPPEVAAPPVRPKIEETVGNFSFHLDGGKMITSNKMGRLINQEILKISSF